MIKLIDLEVYKVALDIGDKVWDIVDRWDFFNKDTLGKQFVKAADSVALNIAEGYGRFFYKENKNFNYYSRGSAFESTSCLRKAIKRKLISEEENLLLRQLFARYLKLMNGYIKSIGTEQKLNEIGEDETDYKVKETDNLENLLTNDLMTNDPITNTP
ncbi:MAG: four helix bundle protein [Chitinophagaceae bacterium]|nr:four helix bundle protein [Chitinophagaceae bacterium]